MLGAEQHGGGRRDSTMAEMAELLIKVEKTENVWWIIHVLGLQTQLGFGLQVGQAPKA